jgi:HemY protein
MKLILWLLALFGMAVAAALFAGNNQGTVTLFWPPYRLDLSLNLVLLLAVGLFFILHLALRALAVLLSLPGQARRWRIQRQERALHAGVLDALSHLMAGRFIRARKAAQTVLAQEQSLARSEAELPYAQRLRALTHLLAAESAHALHDQAAREEHVRLGMEQARHEQEVREGLQLRAARWAFDDRDVELALQRLEALPQGVARRTLALRLRFKVARLAQRHLVALETMRLLAKHKAFSEVAARSIMRGLALELIKAARDLAQLQKAWGQLEEFERRMPEVAMAAADRVLELDGSVALSQQWLLPVWEQMTQGGGRSLPQELRIQLVRVLERGFARASGALEPAWLARIESAQAAYPGDALLHYLAGMACMQLSLWGKAQRGLKQCLPQLQDAQLRRNAWRALALLAEQRDEPAAALEAWRHAAQG